MKLKANLKQEILNDHINEKDELRKNFGIYKSKRNAFIEQLTRLDTKYHLTLQFSFDTSELKVKSLFKEFMKNLNVRVYKDRFRKGENYIHGYVIMERTYAKQTFHMHVLLGNAGYYPDEEYLLLWLNKQMAFTKRVDGKNHITGFKLQNYYNLGSNDLEHYLTKNFEYLAQDMAASTIAPLSENGAEFG